MGVGFLVHYKGVSRDMPLNGSKNHNDDGRGVKFFAKDVLLEIMKVDPYKYMSLMESNSQMRQYCQIRRQSQRKRTLIQYAQPMWMWTNHTAVHVCCTDKCRY